MGLDANPTFFREWEHLGHAVAVRAVQDYVILQKKITRLSKTDDSAYCYMDELVQYGRFFRSKYFSAICPKYDGWELAERLEKTWKDLPHIHHTAKPAVSNVDERMYMTGKPDGRGKYERKKKKEEGTAWRNNGTVRNGEK